MAKRSIDGSHSCLVLKRRRTCQLKNKFSIIWLLNVGAFTPCSRSHPHFLILQIWQLTTRLPS